MPERTRVEQALGPADAPTGPPAETDPAVLPPRDLRRTQTTLLAVLVGLAVLYTLYFTRDVLLPIFLAFLFALLLRPPVKAMRRRRIPEPLGAALVVLGGLALVIYGVTTLATPATDWLDRAPQVIAELRAKLEALQEGLREARQATEQLERMTDDADQVPEVVVKGPSLADAILSQTQLVLAQALITTVLTYFFLAFGRHTLESVIRSLPSVGERLHLVDIVNTVQINISTYLLTITAINTALGALVALVMWGLGLPNPVLWGVLAGLLNFVPYLGSAATVVILFLVALLSFDDWLSILLPPAAFLLMTSLEGNFITPTVVGRRLTLNPIFVFATVLFWGWLWGVPGGLLAVPILAVFKILCDATPPLRTIGALIGG